MSNDRRFTYGRTHEGQEIDDFAKTRDASARSAKILANLPAEMSYKATRTSAIALTEIAEVGMGARTEAEVAAGPEE